MDFLHSYNMYDGVFFAEMPPSAFIYTFCMKCSPVKHSQYVAAAPKGRTKV